MSTFANLTNELKKQVDYIIIGLGIAGASIAKQLINRNRSFVVIDAFHEGASSRVATGIINPVTGRKMVKSWMVDDLLPYSKEFYEGFEALLDIKVRHPMPIYKIFSSVQEQNLWSEKSCKTGYESFLSDIFFPEWEPVKTPFGVGVIHNGAWIDTELLVNTFRQYLIDNDQLIEASLEHADLKISEAIHFKDILADRIVFCEGAKIKQNPFFNHLPFRMAKGEVMTIETNAFESVNGLISKHGFVLPYGNNRYGVGATFEWEDLTYDTTQKGLGILQEKVSKLTDQDYSIIRQRAGIRPTVKDRRPLIGTHQVYDNVHIFNGMGTKGISLSPYFSDHLLQHIEDDLPLMREVNIKRFE